MKAVYFNDLSKTRFKLIADFPGNRRILGSILYCHNKPEIDFYDKYPHLFKKMHWWEERQESEMPMYLKHSCPSLETSYHKIEKWDMEILVGFTDVKRRECCSLLGWNPEYTYKPATEEEYLNSLRNEPSN